MFAPLIATLIMSLVIMSFNSVGKLGVSPASFVSKQSNEVTSIIALEKHVFLAIDNLCRNDYNACKAKYDSTYQDIDLVYNDYKNYIPPSVKLTSNMATPFIGTSIIDNNSTLKIEHRIPLQEDRKSWFSNGGILASVSECAGPGEIPPCSSANVVRKVKLSPYTRVVFLQKAIDDIDNQLAAGGLTPEEEQALNDKKSDLEAQRDAQQQIIDSTKTF